MKDGGIRVAPTGRFLRTQSMEPLIRTVGPLFWSSGMRSDLQRKGISAQAIVKATVHYKNSAKLLEASKGFGVAMCGLEISVIPEIELLAERGM